jgi:hypothetical protein
MVLRCEDHITLSRAIRGELFRPFNPSKHVDFP